MSLYPPLQHIFHIYPQFRLCCPLYPPGWSIPASPSYPDLMPQVRPVQNLIHAPLIFCIMLNSLSPPQSLFCSSSPCLTCSPISVPLFVFPACMSPLPINRPYKSPTLHCLSPLSAPTPNPTYPPGTLYSPGGDNLVALKNERDQVSYIRVHIAVIVRLIGLLKPGLSLRMLKM